jgi:membrane protease YdiL (CAAX protease family)
MTISVGMPDLTRHTLMADRVRSWQIKALIAFVVLTFGWTWGLLWVGATFTLQPRWIGTATIIASAFGPSLAGMTTVVLFDGLPGVKRWLNRCLFWRVGWGWYAIAALVPLGLMVFALALHAAMSGAVPPSPAVESLWLSALILGQILLLGGPLGEEFGWRGYALPALTHRIGWRWASLTVGSIWALWHLPLFFIPGMAQANMPMALFMASTVALSVVFARLSVNTRFSVLPTIVLHWSVNAGSWAIPVTPQNGVMQPHYLVMGLLFTVAIFVFFKPGPEARAP